MGVSGVSRDTELLSVTRLIMTRGRNGKHSLPEKKRMMMAREMGRLIRIVKVMKLMILSQVLLQSERKKKLL